MARYFHYCLNVVSDVVFRVCCKTTVILSRVIGVMTSRLSIARVDEFGAEDASSDILVMEIILVLFLVSV